MNGSADGSKKDTEALERKTLARLLNTPPKPHTTKAEKVSQPKKRGRPSKAKEAN